MFCSPHMANLSHTQVIYNRIRFVLLVDNDSYNRGKNSNIPLRCKYVSYNGIANQTNICKGTQVHWEILYYAYIVSTNNICYYNNISGKGYWRAFFSSKRKTIRLQHPLTRLFLLNERRVTSDINRSPQKLAVSRGLGVLPEGGGGSRLYDIGTRGW